MGKALDAAVEAAEAARVALGCLSLGEVALLARGGVRVVDPFSTLIGRGASIARDVTLWPGATLLIEPTGAIAIGQGAEIGAQGGFTLRAAAGWLLEIGPGARLNGGGGVSGRSRIGAGAQILGAIDARDVTLGDGGDWRSDDPDRRGGVLKGAGRAFGLDVGQGRVIQAFGLFEASQEKAQSAFHPAR